MDAQAKAAWLTLAGCVMYRGILGGWFIRSTADPYKAGLLLKPEPQSEGWVSHVFIAHPPVVREHPWDRDMLAALAALDDELFEWYQGVINGH